MSIHHGQRLTPDLYLPPSTESCSICISKARPTVGQGGSHMHGNQWPNGRGTPVERESNIYQIQNHPYFPFPE